MIRHMGTVRKNGAVASTRRNTRAQRKVGREPASPEHGRHRAFRAFSTSDSEGFMGAHGARSVQRRPIDDAAKPGTRLPYRRAVQTASKKRCASIRVREKAERKTGHDGLFLRHVRAMPSNDGRCVHAFRYGSLHEQQQAVWAPSPMSGFRQPCNPERPSHGVGRPTLLRGICMQGQSPTTTDRGP